MKVTAKALWIHRGFFIVVIFAVEILLWLIAIIVVFFILVFISAPFLASVKDMLGIFVPTLVERERGLF
jgi:hypothetical protein